MTFATGTSRIVGWKWPAVLYALVALFAFGAVSVPAAPPSGKGGGKKDGGGSGYQEDLRIRWTIDIGPNSSVRPAIGPGGEIYAVDSNHTLHIISPDGSQHTTVANAGNKGLDVDPVDGTVYTASENHVKAFHPDGREKWTFIQNPRAFVFSALGVGPDRNVYGVGSSGMGAFSLDRNTGTERWRSTEIYDRSNASFSELAFGPGDSGDQLYYRVNAPTRGLTLDGQQVFEKYIGALTPRVSSIDGSWHSADSAFDSNGDLLWTFAGFPTATGGSSPTLGADGSHYTVNQGLRVYALDSAGNDRWVKEMDENVEVLDTTPSDTQLVMSTSVGPASPAALRAVSTVGGSDLWRHELPWNAADHGLRFVATRLGFSPDGDTAYIITNVASGPAQLTALSLDPLLPNASTWLRSQEVALSARSSRKGVTIKGTVTVIDENRAAVSGAMVRATWTDTYDGSVTQTQLAETGGDGGAAFDLRDDGGVYVLTVQEITKSDYTYDPEHSVLTGSLAKF